MRKIFLSKQSETLVAGFPFGDIFSNTVKVTRGIVCLSEIKYMRDDGLSLHKIAADLNGRGIIGKRGGKFCASTIKAICDNNLHAA